jgi:hypothetical protein
MATLVLAATATPARIVSCRQDCGRLSGGLVIHAYKATGKKDCELAESIHVGFCLWLRENNESNARTVETEKDGILSQMIKCLK